jgi:hypothetical protein
LVVGKKEDLLSQKAKELERKGNKIQRRRRKEYIPADGGKAWHPASLLAWAVTAAATYLGGRCWKVSSPRAELQAAGTQAAAGFTGRHVISRCWLSQLEEARGVIMFRVVTDRPIANT